MLLRWLILLLVQAALAGLGFWVFGPWGAAGGVLLADGR